MKKKTKKRKASVKAWAQVCKHGIILATRHKDDACIGMCRECKLSRKIVRVKVVEL